MAGYRQKTNESRLCHTHKRRMSVYDHCASASTSEVTLFSNRFPNSATDTNVLDVRLQGTRHVAWPIKRADEKFHKYCVRCSAVTEHEINQDRSSVEKIVCIENLAMQ